METPKNQPVYFANPLIGYFTFEDALRAIPDGWRLPTADELQELCNENLHPNRWDEDTKCRIFDNVEVENPTPFDLDRIDRNQTFTFENGLATNPVLDPDGKPIVCISKADAAEIIQFFRHRDNANYGYPLASQLCEHSEQIKQYTNSQGVNYFWTYVEDDINPISGAQEFISVLPLVKPEDVSYKYPQIGIRPTLNLTLCLAKTD
jgi:hypothetical protein